MLSLRNGEYLGISVIIANADMDGFYFFYDSVLLQRTVQSDMRSSGIIIKDLDLIESGFFRISGKCLENSLFGSKPGAEILFGNRTAFRLLLLVSGLGFLPKGSIY